MLTLSFSDNINRLIYFNIKQNYLTPVETGQKFLVNWRDESLSWESLLQYSDKY